MISWRKNHSHRGQRLLYLRLLEHFEQAANALYNMNGWKNLNGRGFEGSAVDQNTDINGLTSNGGGTVQESDWHWDKPYSHIRTCNILLAKANEYDGNQEDIAQSVGTAYFFRAWQHFYLLQYFGGIPIVDHVLDVSDPVLFGVRNSRYEVIDFIASDLRLAIPLCSQKKKIFRKVIKARLVKKRRKHSWLVYCFMKELGRNMYHQ